METSLYWLSEDIVRFKVEVGVEEKCTKMLTPFPMDFLHTPQHTVIINDIIIVGRCLLCTYITRGCLCKHVDVYMITLSCTWQMYALSEHFLVLIMISFAGDNYEISTP